MFRRWFYLGACIVLQAVLAPDATAGVRIKDIVDVEGARGNPLTGIGLVVGLEGTGGRSTFTQKAAVDLLQRFDINTKIASTDRADSVYRSGNISVVSVTAELGPFSRKGGRLDVTVSVYDDATSLQGGTLIMTPLRGADGVDYAVAYGSLSIGGFLFTAPAGAAQPSATAQKNHTTVGRIPNGATVEREARGAIVTCGRMRLLIRQADYTTSRAIAKAINERFPDTSLALDAGTVHVTVPLRWISKDVEFMSEIGMLEVTPDNPARVVINERTGTIVAGEHVRVGTVALTHGNLAISTVDEPIVSQPDAYSRGTTAVLPRARVGVTEQPGQVRVVEKTITVAELARALNVLGVTPRDLIAIFQALKQAGALHAELVIM